MKLSFKITFNTDSGGSIAQVVHLQRNSVRIGRVDSDLTLIEKGVSRRHALLYQDTLGNLRVRDERSRNGTWVLGQRVIDAPLIVGSEFQIGNYTIAILSFSPEQNLSQSVLHRWPEMILAVPSRNQS